MQEPKVLQEIKDEFKKGSLNIRKYFTKLKDEELKEFFKDKYPTVKNITEKIYLYLHNLQEPPKNKRFVDFKYVDPPKQTIGSITPSMRDSQVKVIFSEQEFMKYVSNETVYLTTFKSTKAMSNLMVLYIPTQKIVYVSLVPMDLHISKFIISFSKDFNTNIIQGIIDLDILKDLPFTAIESCSDLTIMCYIQQKKSSLVSKTN